MRTHSYVVVHCSAIHLPTPSQVAIMQQEIIELQPELIKTSEETHTLMVKIEKDTVEAEAKKEVGWLCGVLATFCVWTRLVL